MRRIVLLAFLVPAFLDGSPVSCAEPAGEKLLMGFEETEVNQWAGVLNVKPEKATTRDGVPHLVLKTSFGSDHWRIFKGKASQGDWAMGLTRVRTGEELPFDFKVPAEPQRFFG